MRVLQELAEIYRLTDGFASEPHHHVVIQELQDWAYTGNRLRRSPNVDLGYHAAKAACPSSIKVQAGFRGRRKAWLPSTDTHFVVYMNAKDPKPSQELHSREVLAPIRSAQ